MLKTFSITDTGRKRKLNQDYVYTSEQPVGLLPNLFLVADGMGGHNAGDYASKYTVEIIVREIAASDKKSTDELLGEAITKANESIRKKAGEDFSLSGMGTTLVAAAIIDDCLHVANVGDSRLYVVNGEIKQITRDHSLVEEMILKGGIDRESARYHPNKNIITRAIGASDTVDVDFFAVNLAKGDIVLMCSDGLTNMLEDDEIRMILNKQCGIDVKAQELVNAANCNGGKDNIAVVLIEPFV